MPVKIDMSRTVYPIVLTVPLIELHALSRRSFRLRPV